MTELYTFIRDFGPAANTLILVLMAYFLREVRNDVRDIHRNHLPHIYAEMSKIAQRISAIEGVKSGVELERMKGGK